MRQQSVACRLLERNELLERGKQALCGAFLSILALIVAAILAVLSLPPSRMLSPERDRRPLGPHDVLVTRVTDEPERAAPESNFAISGPAFSLAYAPNVPREVETVRDSKAGIEVASSKHVHIKRTFVAASLVRHGKRSHAVLAHAGAHHRRATVAVGKHDRRRIDAKLGGDPAHTVGQLGPLPIPDKQTRGRS